MRASHSQSILAIWLAGYRLQHEYAWTPDLQFDDSVYDLLSACSLHSMKMNLKLVAPTAGDQRADDSAPFAFLLIFVTLAIFCLPLAQSRWHNSKQSARLEVWKLEWRTHSPGQEYRLRWAMLRYLINKMNSDYMSILEALYHTQSS